MDDLLNQLLQAVRAAGKEILALRASDLDITRKANNDIVTRADLAANDILRKQLAEPYPEYGWLSEESVDDAQRLRCRRTWIVDPVDGTKEFAAGIPEYAVSVALVEDGVPILGAVFNPVTDELFHAAKGHGAWLGETRIHCRSQAGDKLLLLASRSECQRGEWDEFQRSHDVVIIGSIAYKLGLVAAGKADATFSLGPKSEWDIAAGLLLVKEAGGVVTNQRREEFVFNRENVLVDGIVASSELASERVFKLIK